MQFAGVPIGPRKMAGLALLAAGVAIFATITYLVGVEFGLILVAGVLGVLSLGLAIYYIEARRRHREISEQLRATRHLADTARRAAADSARGNAELANVLGRIEERLQSIAGENVDIFGKRVRSVSSMLEVHLARLEAAQGDTLNALVHLRAEQRRWQEADAPALHASVEAEAQLIRESSLFDPERYRRRAGLSAEEDPVAHYVQHGVALRLDPHPLFASAWYLARHPEALQRWRTPLAHFLAESDAHDLDAHPAFWSRWYAERFLDDDFRGIPVEHFLQRGAEDGSDPNPLFDTRWYVSALGRNALAGVNPLVHYLTVGAAQDRDPSPLFSTADARRRLGATADPLSTFLDLERDGDPMPAIVDDEAADDRQREANRKWEYLTRGLYREPDTFVLYRIIGNDLPPRHREGQSLENLRFILDHEPDLSGCEKRFVVNRIVNPTIEKEIMTLLDERGMPYLHIPFDPEEYRKVPWHFTGFDPPGFTYRREFDELDSDSRQRALDHVYHEKNLYVMNNNGARNAALREGRGLAKWVLPWDGNCFVTASAWNELVKEVRKRPYLKYFTVPMARILDNNTLLRPDPQVDPSEEPQLLFRRDAEEQFDPKARYGRRPKVYLFYRLGIRGLWDRWKQRPYEPPRPSFSPAAGPVGEAGWVARLFSGREQLEGDINDRGARRIEAIRERIDRIDEELAGTTFHSSALFTLDDKVLAQQRERYEAKESGAYEVISDLITRAEQCLDRPVYTVTAKTSLPPSGDPHDYWHPAPYWWPNPNTPDGLPYVTRDGVRVPGTVLWEAGSEKYDRSALQSMIDETTSTALAGYFTDEERFFERGADLLRTWFINHHTRMNPHLRYAQVRRGHNQDEGTSTGIIEVNDFYYLLDAVRLVERSGALTTVEADALREWFSAYRTWLENSSQGRRECAAINNHGTWYDVQIAAINAYLNDVRGVLATLRRSHERVWQQFEPDGRQLDEMRRTTTQHYCTYNLQAWVLLATCAERVGQDLWTYRSPDGRGLMPALRWLLSHVGHTWPYEQIDEFDTARWPALYYQLPLQVRSNLPSSRFTAEDEGPWTVKQVFSPHDGIRPFWLVGNLHAQGTGTHRTPTAH